MPSVVEIGSVVPEKKILEDYLPYIVYGHGGHLGHATWIILKHIGSYHLQMLLVKFGFHWPSNFREDRCILL